MECKYIRKSLEDFSKENYKEFIKAFNDAITLLSEEFDYIIEGIKDQGKIVESTN